MNETLKKFGQGWRFADTAQNRDQRPQGNDARALLSRRGLLAELLTKVFGEASSAEEVSAMRAMNRAVQGSTSLRPAVINAPAPPVAAAAGRKKKK
eukprot:2197272-Pleurochrysis_carterae.AAC.1